MNIGGPIRVPARLRGICTPGPVSKDVAVEDAIGAAKVLEDAIGC